MTTTLDRRAGGHTGTRPVSRFVSTGIVVLILALLLIFFVLPAIWLLLAPTKTAGQLIHDFPLSFGSFGQLGAAWQHLTSFQSGAIFQWCGNSAAD